MPEYQRTKNMTTKTVIIAQSTENVGLQKEQKQFNQLTKKIASKRKTLQEWHETITEFKQMYAQEFAPQIAKHNALRIEMVYLIDDYFDQKVFTNKEREKMCQLIAEVAETAAVNNERIKHIYNKRLEQDFDEVQQTIDDIELDYLKDYIKANFDINVGDEFKSKEEIMRYVDKELRERQESSEEPAPEHIAPKQKKKKAKSVAKEADKQAYEQQVSKSIREVYRQLASALHPDRIANDAEYAYKNELMQRVNAANDKQDLLTLLEIQLEIEQISQDNINGIALEKLKHFNQVLNAQVSELDREIYETQGRFRFEHQDLELFPNGGKPVVILKALKSHILHAISDVSSLRFHLAMWQENPRNFKSYLKTVDIEDDLELAEMWY